MMVGMLIDEVVDDGLDGRKPSCCCCCSLPLVIVASLLFLFLFLFSFSLFCMARYVSVLSFWYLDGGIMARDWGTLGAI